MASRIGCLVGCVFMIPALLQGSAAQTIHVIGGSIGWTVPPPGFSYDTWAATQTFMESDFLSFDFTSTKDEVAQVFTKADYDSCSMTNNFVTYSFVINSTLIVLIGTPGVEQYYFSTIGCEMNQKVTINVSGSPTSSSSSSSSSSNSYTYSNSSSSYSSYSSTSSASALTVGVDFFILLLSTVIASFC